MLERERMEGGAVLGARVPKKKKKRLRKITNTNSASSYILPFTNSSYIVHSLVAFSHYSVDSSSLNTLTHIHRHFDLGVL